MITNRLAISEDSAMRIRPSNFLVVAERTLSAVSARVSAIKADVIRRSRVFSLDSVDSIAVTGRKYKRTVTAKDLGEYYFHTIVGR